MSDAPRAFSVSTEESVAAYLRYHRFEVELPGARPGDATPLAVLTVDDDGTLVVEVAPGARVLVRTDAAGYAPT